MDWIFTLAILTVIGIMGNIAKIWLFFFSFILGSVVSDIIVLVVNF